MDLDTVQIMRMAEGEILGVTVPITMLNYESTVVLLNAYCLGFVYLTDEQIAALSPPSELERLERYLNRACRLPIAILERCVEIVTQIYQNRTPDINAYQFQQVMRRLPDAIGWSPLNGDEQMRLVLLDQQWVDSALVTGRSALTAPVAEVIASRCSPTVLQLLIRRSETPGRLLVEMLNHSDEQVRQTAIDHPNLPRAALAMWQLAHGTAAR
jgi:hypothetical protein